MSLQKEALGLNKRVAHVLEAGLEVFTEDLAA